MDKDKKYSFNKSEKITSKKTINSVIKKGKVLKTFPFYVRFLETDEINVRVKVLISVGKRRFKKAVDRNRIKRIIRETYRLNKNILFSCLEKVDKKIVLHFIYVDLKMPDYKYIEQVVQEILLKLCDKLSQNGKK